MKAQTPMHTAKPQPVREAARDAAPSRQLGSTRPFGAALPPTAAPHRLHHSLASLGRPAAPIQRSVIQARFENDRYQAALGLGNHQAAARELAKANQDQRQQAIQGTAVQHLRGLFNATTHLRSKVDLFEPLHRHEADQTYQQDALIHGHDLNQVNIRAGARLDARASIDALKERQSNMSVFTWDSTKRGQVDDLDALKTRTRQIEQRHRISLRSTDPKHMRGQDPRGHRDFTHAELSTVDSVLGRLPHAHVRDNPELSFIGREQSPQRDPNDQETGAEYQTGDQGVHVYDVSGAGAYRGVGQTSDLARHGQGHEVTSLEDVLTHEIGHSVHANMANEFQAFQQAAGWQRLDDHQALTQALTAGGQQQQAAQGILAQMNLQRNLPFGQRAEQLHDGYHYMVDPDNDQRFYRRRADNIPGDAHTPQSAQHDLMAYAKTSPKEHFAEMYSQMVHLPERVYADYVTAPEQRHRDASQAYQQGFGDNAVTLQQLGGLARARDERARQRDAMRDQWNIMRGQVFGVTQNLVDQHAQAVRQRATGRNLPGVQVDALERAFRRQAERAATPEQLQRLRQRHFQHVDEV